MLRECTALVYVMYPEPVEGYAFRNALGTLSLSKGT